jgi:hypothetical protein
MPVQPISFPLLNSDSTNPVMAGMQRSANLSNSVADYLTKALQQEKMKKLMPFIEPMAQENLIKSQLFNQYYGPEKQSEINLRGAETNRSNALTNLPFAGRELPGAAGKALGLEMIKMKYGEDSPIYQTAKQQFDLEQKSVNSRINYQDTLSNTAPTRALSPLGKGIIEEQNLRSNRLPTGQEGQLPGIGNELAEQYALQRQKQTTDTSARQKTLFATNIDKTISQIDPKSLTQFSGIKGKSQLLAEQAKSSTGNPSEKFINFSNNLQRAELLATQVRQFYGDSIQPSMIQRLEKLTNPSSWINDPKSAEQSYESFIKLLRMETKTYQDALKNSNVYKEGSGNSSNGIIKYIRDKSGKIVKAQ